MIIWDVTRILQIVLSFMKPRVMISLLSNAICCVVITNILHFRMVVDCLEESAVVQTIWFKQLNTDHLRVATLLQEQEDRRQMLCIKTKVCLYCFIFCVSDYQLLNHFILIIFICINFIQIYRAKFQMITLLEITM